MRTIDKGGEREKEQSAGRNVREEKGGGMELFTHGDSSKGGGGAPACC